MRSVKFFQLAFVLFALSIGAATHAHSHLVSSVPANGSTVAKSPSEIRLVFKDEVQLTAVTVESPNGTKHEMKLNPVKSKLTDLPMDPLPPGAYTVTWRAVGADGHVMTGKFSFNYVAK